MAPPVWQSEMKTPPDWDRICRDQLGRITICPKSIKAGDLDPAFLRAIMLGRISTLANSLAQIMPDYTYVFGDAWDPDTGWLNLLSRLQVELILDYTPFTDVAGLVSPIGGVYDILPPPVVVVDENDNTVEFWNEPPWLWVRIPSGATGPTVKLYAVVDPLIYDPAMDRPDPLFPFIDTFETWSGWVERGYGDCFQRCGVAREGVCYLSKENYCDPNGCTKQLPFQVDRGSQAVVMEMWIYRPYAGTDCPWDQVLIVDSAGNGYNIAVDMINARMRIIKRTSWSGTTLVESTVSPAKVSTWYFARLALFPDGKIVAEVWDEDLNKLSVAEATDTSYSLFDTLAVLGGRPYRVDVLRLRWLPYQAGVYQLEPVVTLSDKQVYAYPVELGETIQSFTATIDADEVLRSEYTLDGGQTWQEFQPETVVDVAGQQATSIGLRFTVRGEVRAWAMLVKTL